MPRSKPYVRKGTLPAEDRLVYTVAEAGLLLNLSERSAYEAAHRGEIPSIRLGSRLVVPKAALDAMLSGKPADAA